MSRTRFLSVALLGVSFLLTASCALSQKKPSKSARAKAQKAADAEVDVSPEQRSILSFDEYEHLLNLILPIDHAAPPSLEYTMVLRFEPHVHPESQIVVRHWRDGRIEATVYRVEHGNAWRAAYGNVPQGGQPDYAAMKEQVSIKKNSFLLSPEMEQKWHNEMFPSLAGDFGKVRNVAKNYKREDHGVVDGTRYELFYIQGDDEIHFVSWDSEVEAFPTGTYPLTKWMNLIRWHANGHMMTYVPVKASAPLAVPTEKKADK